jgi:hypothetical protein
MTFDEAYQDYQDKRALVRELQGAISKAEAEYVKRGKELEMMKKKYRGMRAKMIEAGNMLIPELQKEMNNHPTLEKQDEQQDSQMRSTRV